MSLALIGLSNVAGSLTVGWLPAARQRMKHCCCLAVYFTRVPSRSLVFMAAPKNTADVLCVCDCAWA